MSSLNKVILVGRVTRDPELRYTPDGTPVASFGLAVDRNRGRGNERETDFIDITVWRQTAEFTAKYATKGRMVGVDGRLQVSKFKTREGQDRTKYEVVANEVQLLDSKRDGSTGDRSGGYESGRSGGYESGNPSQGQEAPPRERETVYQGAAANEKVGHDSSGGFDDDIPF